VGGGVGGGLGWQGSPFLVTTGNAMAMEGSSCTGHCRTQERFALSLGVLAGLGWQGSPFLVTTGNALAMEGKSCTGHCRTQVGCCVHCC
jgi:hypothetical protein